MKDKYYTPELEEFHIGFRYELKESRDKWYRHVLDADDYITHAGVDYNHFEENMIHYRLEGHIRVKHLDRKDIEELGWKYREGRKIQDSFVIEGRGSSGHWILWLNEKKGTISIWDCVKELCFYPISGVKVKNYNELKTIMKQIGIA